MPLPVLLLLGIVFGVMVLAGVLAKQPDVLCVLIPSAALVTLGYALGKGDERVIRVFLQTTLEAQRASYSEDQK